MPARSVPNAPVAASTGPPSYLPALQEHVASLRADLETARAIGAADYVTANLAAQFAAQTGLTITVCHLPPGTSKWNKIEHRLFSAISRNWRGRPLESHEIVIETLKAVTTTTGLTVHAELDTNTYERGIKIHDKDMKTLEDTGILTRHEFHGDWNYSVNPATRRRNPPKLPVSPKSDPLDAYHAARAVLSGRATSDPKDQSTEAIRSLHNTRRSAVKARTAATNQITAMLITAPDGIRSKYRALQGQPLITALAKCRTAVVDPVDAAVLTALKALAHRHHFLTAQAEELSTLIDALVTTANPALRAAFGVGPDTAAQLLITAGANPDRLRSEASFAALCGVSPVPASSGKTTRHRLSRGGDRHANNALYRIALSRMAHEPRTKQYVARHVAAGRTTKEILRMLKRAIAREIHRLLTHKVALPEYADLRPARQAKNITVTAAANAFNIWPTVISRIERGLQRDDDLANRYRTWLRAA